MGKKKLLKNYKKCVLKIIQYHDIHSNLIANPFSSASRLNSLALLDPSLFQPPPNCVYPSKVLSVLKCKF